MTDENPQPREDFGKTVSRWVEEAFAKTPGGEEFIFQVASVTTPQGRVMPMVLVWLRGAQLGTVIPGGFSFENPFMLTAEEVDSTVKAACDQMLSVRSKELAAGNGHAPPNGHPLLGGQ